MNIKKSVKHNYKIIIDDDIELLFINEACAKYTKEKFIKQGNKVKMYKLFNGTYLDMG